MSKQTRDNIKTHFFSKLMHYTNSKFKVSSGAKRREEFLALFKEVVPPSRVQGKNMWFNQSIDENYIKIAKEIITNLFENKIPNVDDWEELAIMYFEPSSSIETNGKM